MSSVHCIVVWEWQSEGLWLPHTPAVARTLERAHAKKLTRVVLADADPALKGHYVNLRTLTQSSDTPDGCVSECSVRRSCYSVQSAGGRGARWEWARLGAPPHAADLHYEPLPMEVQCRLEESWCAGGGAAVRWGGWVAGPGLGAARRGGSVRLLRRHHQPPYPLARHPAPPPPPPPHPIHHHVEGVRCRIPQQHTGSSVQSMQSVQSAPAPRAPRDPAPRPGARSVSPPTRKPNLARQILHNLNIFSNNKAVVSVAEGTGTDAESGTESVRTRRHSVDTVSTYLSHESKDSLQHGSVGELLNCSAGSDDVFEPPPAPRDPAAHPPDPDGTIVGLDPASAAMCAYVSSASCVQWGAVCPVCLGPLGGGGGGAPAVALRPCHHLLHLHCLNRHLADLAHKQEPLYIECLVCGRVYGGGAAATEAGGGGARDAPETSSGDAREAAAGGGGAGGAQPAGSMAWRLQPGALPGHPPHTNTILVTYNFQSGRQGPEHPAPGAPYYAVGFPRHSLLPDTPLGRQVLSLLVCAWERGVLFCVSASRTTGREHVVAWRVQPPPHRRAHASPAHLHRARDALQDLLGDLPAHHHQQSCGNEFSVT